MAKWHKQWRHSEAKGRLGLARHLGTLLDRYEGDLELALAAYNAGAGAVAKYGGVPPYKETREYVERVLRRARGKR